MLKDVNNIVFIYIFLPLQKAWQRKVKLSREGAPSDLVLGKAVQLHYADPSRQSLSYITHHIVLLGTCQPKIPRFFASVAHDLNLFKKLRGLLYFVDDDRRPVPLKEKNRIALCERPHHRVVKAHISPALPFGQMLQHSSLTNLPRSRDQNSLKESTHMQKFSLQCTAYIFQAISTS